MESANIRLDRIENEIVLIKNRIFNGIAKEIRSEVEKSIGGLRIIVITFLISLLLAFAGLIIEGRLSSGSVSEENMRNYKAIVEMQRQIEDIRDTIGQ